MPRSEEQYEQIREERKKQIMNVALEVIAEVGFSNSSISRIAAKAKISKGLMYNYFKSKEDLIAAIIIDGFEVLTASFDQNKDGVLTEEELHYFIDASFDALRKNIRIYRMYFMVLLQPEVLKLVDKQLKEAIAPFMKITYNYFAEKGSDDPIADVMILAAMLDGIGLHYVLDPLNYPFEGVKKKIHALL